MRRSEFKKLSVWLLIIVFAGIACGSSADAYYRHRSYRGYRSGRGYNRMAGVQRAAAAMSAAQARLYAAQVNAARQIRRARQQAENSPGVTSAKNDNVRATQEFQTARAAVIAKLKETNTDFRDLTALAQTKRSQIQTLARSGNSPEEMQNLESQLKTIVRKITLIEDQAVDADPAVKEIIAHKGTIHSSLKSAEQDALNAASKDPAVQAAQKQLAQAQQQAMQAAGRYNGALSSMGNSGGYGGGNRGRRYGYGGYGRIGVVHVRSGYGGGYHHHAFHHPQVQRAVHHSVRRRR
jgi:chromosome segregation ATPase